MLISNKFLKEFQAFSSREAMTVWYVFKLMIANLYLASNYCTRYDGLIDKHPEVYPALRILAYSKVF